MARYEEHLLHVHLVNAKIGTIIYKYSDNHFTEESLLIMLYVPAHWNNFRYFMAVLDSASSKTEIERSRPLCSLSSKPRTPDFNDSSLTDWIASDASPRHAKIRLGDQTDSSKVLASVARDLHQGPQVLWDSCPAIDMQDDLGEADTYLYLLKQIATQQPRVLLHIQHLMPILTDAVSSGTKSWKERAL